MPIKIYASPTRKGFYEVQINEGPIQQINALDKEAIADGNDIIRIVRRETALTFNTFLFSELRDANNASVGATRAEVLAYLNAFLGGIEGSGSVGEPVSNDLPANTEVALKNPDGTPWLVGGKQVFAKLVEATTNGANFVVLAENVDVVVSVTSLLRNQGNPSFQGLSGLNNGFISANYRSGIGLVGDDVVLNLATDDDGTWNVRAVIQYTKL